MGTGVQRIVVLAVEMLGLALFECAKYGRGGQKIEQRLAEETAENDSGDGTEDFHALLTAVARQKSLGDCCRQ